MELKKSTVICISVVMSLISCSSPPEKISASYVSPIHYQNTSCDQLSSEIYRLNEKVIEVSGMQQKDANQDAVATGVGMIVFWPALFLLAGNDHSDELARLKGEYEAITTVAVEKRCVVAEQIVEARKARNQAIAERQKTTTENWLD